MQRHFNEANMDAIVHQRHERAIKKQGNTPANHAGCCCELLPEAVPAGLCPFSQKVSACRRQCFHYSSAVGVAAVAAALAGAGAVQPDAVALGRRHFHLQMGWWLMTAHGCAIPAAQPTAPSSRLLFALKVPAAAVHQLRAQCCAEARARRSGGRLHREHATQWRQEPRLLVSAVGERAGWALNLVPGMTKRVRPLALRSRALQRRLRQVPGKLAASAALPPGGTRLVLACWP